MANRDTALSREQHAFLQALMAKGAMPEKSAKRLYAEIASMDPAEANKTFSRFWNPIASALGYLDLDIRVIKYQEDGELYMGVVNKTGGEAAKLATRLTPEQIALFRVVLDEIMRDDRTVERGVDVITALNATQVAPTQGETQGDRGLSQAQTQSVAKMSKMEKEATLKQLCKDGWLAQTDDEAGFLKLGVRAFLELKEFLLEQAPERARAKWERML
uniref:Non-structural maintenance of chromosomes element 1 homolog n=1 Tax=Micromonas pusilla TaxID=38833 RepID=A0A7S0NLS0_MICPS|mmetsp:Transcript_6605/g.27456  ORF Transcript_6605/g.27456 Transcript_6605/m.27456 type:complete len:217 (+) Transcript_6605:153-803(+)